MITTTDPKVLSKWLMDNFMPGTPKKLLVWNEMVRKHLDPKVLPGLVQLVLHGDREEQYQALGAARALGADIWADQDEPPGWDVRLPGQTRSKHYQPATAR